jgi:uncharacterized protein (DUF1810 family)
MPDLSRFHAAQARDYATALAELRRGRKDGHWIWYVFPQLRGLGRSATAQRYGIADLAEARAYLADPVLGPRLREAVEALVAHPDPVAVLGGLDATKARSSLTLFHAAGAGWAGEAIARLYGGEADPVTLSMLREAGDGIRGR